MAVDTILCKVFDRIRSCIRKKITQRVIFFIQGPHYFSHLIDHFIRKTPDAAYLFFNWQMLLSFHANGFTEKFYLRKPGTKIIMHVSGYSCSFLFDSLFSFKDRSLDFKFTPYIKSYTKKDQSNNRK